MNWLGIPDVIWSAVVAAGIAFASSTLSNRNSRKQVKMQLDHAARQADRERAMALRRDVYLPAIEAVVRLQANLGRLSNLEVNSDEIANQFAQDLAALGKVYLVGNDATIAALQNYRCAVGPAYLDLLVMRGPLLSRKKLIEIQQRYMDATIAAHGHFIQMGKERIVVQGADHATRERINELCAREMMLFNTYAAKQSELVLEQASGQLAMGEKLLTIVEDTSTRLPDVLLAARQDIDLDVDHLQFRALFAEEQRAVIAKLRDVIAQSKTMVQRPNPAQVP